jgi:hypothetical protein
MIFRMTEVLQHLNAPVEFRGARNSGIPHEILNEYRWSHDRNR